MNVDIGSLAEVTEDFIDSDDPYNYLRINWIKRIKRLSKDSDGQNDGGYYPEMFKLVYNANSSNIDYNSIEEFIKEIENII